MFIRNFAIIAHVDHGKSTLADRFLELTGIVAAGKHEEQLLDRNPISRERGITIKLAPVRMFLRSESMSNFFISSGSPSPTFVGQTSQVEKNLTSSSDYILNLIDTPGHVDFSYEVDRTLACVEGVILLVDATQGIQAQTIANAYKAIEKNLVIIPAINKIDLPNAEVEKTKKQLVDFLGVKDEEVFLVSAKTGQGVKELLEAVIKKIPDPNTPPNPLSKRGVSINNTSYSPLERGNGVCSQSLIFDSYYDSHRGVIIFVRVFSGELKKGLKVKLANLKTNFEINEVGYFLPDLTPSEKLVSGEIGYVVTNLKDIHQVAVGDTVVDFKEQDDLSLPGYKKIKSMVFASIFPTDTADYLNLKKALEKLSLNDSSLQFQGVYSQALGTGFRVGFLGLLHADVIRERLEREFGLSLVLTPPKVEYQDTNIRGVKKEPWVKVIILTPEKYLGDIMQLMQRYRSQFLTMDNKNQIILEYEMPMAEMITDFFDALKSVSSGFASLDWQFLDYRDVKADELKILINNQPVEEFSEIVVEEKAYERASYLTSKLKDLIPRQQYEVKIQGQYKGRIIASTRIAPFRKDVLMKSGKVLGTGDVGRKKKLLEKQKEGKKRMKMVGKVEVPKEAFMKLFKKN
ncbi:MAG: elongation factor 4 [Patescibacteria group bacterium]|nr:MAG: elongation factor 4 [Patescibacteria group bacterium]